MRLALRGIFLTSDNPAETARFYREVAGLDLEQVGAAPNYSYWKYDREGIQLAIHDAKAFAPYSHPVNLTSNVTHLYFKIASQAEFLSHLKSLGQSLSAIDDVVVTVKDPDGRMVMFGAA